MSIDQIRLGSTYSCLGRLKDQADLRRRFAGLRIDLETFRNHMRIDANFPMNEYNAQFDALRGRYSEAYQLLKNDFFLTRSLENECQNDLDVRLREELQR